MLIIIPLFFIFTRILASNVDLCGELLDECKLIDDRYICPKLDLNPRFIYSNTYQNCTMGSFKIYFNLNKASIIDNTFNLDLIEEKCQYLKYTTSYRYYYMRNIKGFDINYNIYPIISFVYIYFYDSIFEFYSNGKLIRSCDDLKPGIDPMPFFRNIMGFNTTLHLKTVKFKTRICPLIFKSMPQRQLNLDYMIDTFYKRNLLEFHHLENVTDINSWVINLFFYNTEKIDLNSVLLNNLVFKNIEMLGIYGEVKSIQTGLLRSFKKLKLFIMDPFFLRQLFHRKGADWLRDLNSDFYVDLENRSQIESLMKANKWLIFDIDMYKNYMSYYLDRDSLFKIDLVFPNEDFCLYKQFPFNQLVIMAISSRNLFFGLNSTFSCTFVWFIKYYDIYSDYIPDLNINVRMNLSQEIIKCDFNKR
jgi:hypothetical protein